MKKIVFLLFGFVVVGVTDTGFAAPKISACGDVVCREYPTGGGYATGRCDGVDADQPCSRLIEGEKANICRDFSGTKACAATECSEGWVLWLTNTRKPAPQSQGRCFNREKMDAWCREGCGCDEPREICALNEISFSNRGKNVQAFVGEEACHCVPNPDYEEPIPPTPENCETKYAGNQARIQCCKWAEEDNPKKDVHWNEETNSCECNDRNLKLNMETGECYSDDGTPDIEGDCRYTFRAAVVCNGKRVFKFTSFRISKEMAKSLKLPSCKPGEIVTIEERYKEDVANFNKLRDEVCGKPGNIFDITYDDNDTEYLDAKNRIDAFMRNADLNKNVWKNEEGKFNTSRLASDLTAGVVLGTVGGIVSANVIKKKQIEKGFDALNCTVGGQKVADWGDVFNVGLRRY